jgi:uncharacterized protein YjiK
MQPEVSRIVRSDSLTAQPIVVNERDVLLPNSMTGRLKTSLSAGRDRGQLRPTKSLRIRWEIVDWRGMSFPHTTSAVRQIKLRSMRENSDTEFHFDGMFEIPGVHRDASAITIHAETGHLWVVTDDKIRLVEFTSEGELIREVKLTGFEDTEGLCHVGGNRFLIAEEAKMCVTLITVPPDATSIKADGYRIQLDAKSKKNKGLEGVSYNATTDTLYAVREGKPPTVFRIQPVLNGDSSKTSPWSIDLNGIDDLSDTFFDSSTGWLWLVSHESQIAVAIDTNGERVTEVILKKGYHGLDSDVEQAEGIVRDTNGTLFICSEPNQIYRFRPVPRRR